MSTCTALFIILLVLPMGCSNDSKARHSDTAGALKPVNAEKQLQRNRDIPNGSKGDSIVMADASSPEMKTRRGGAQVDAGSVSMGLASLSLNLYRQLSKNTENLFFAPYSISTVFAMTYAGARGGTASELAKVFGYKLPLDKLHAAYASLNSDLIAAEHVSLHTANALWACQECNLRTDFLDLTKRWYRAGIQKLDFGDEPAARSRINRWVETQTRQKIKELIAKGVLDARTRLVLANAIYFKGQWASRFEKPNTQSRPFYVAGAKKIQTASMHQTASLRYAETQTEQLLELPYRGNQFALLVLLPKERNGIGRLEKRLTPQYLDTMLRGLSQQQVQVVLPKFKIEQSFSLIQPLVKLGVRKAFDPGQADFSGMYAGDDRIHISDVLHKAYLDINEQGTEAAAATAVVMTYSAQVVEPKVFRADHPFVFMIRHNPTDSILFMGRLLNPAG